MRLVEFETSTPMQMNLFRHLPEVKRQNIPAPERFRKMLKKKRSGCIEFTGAIDPSSIGYGRFREAPGEDGKIWMAHRYAYFLHHGAVPPLLRHTCHNPACCNVGHLKPGTHQDNTDDMIAAGRKRAALKPAQVIEIVELHRQGMKPAMLAKKYSINQLAINSLLIGRTHSNTTGIEYVPAKSHQRKLRLAA